VNWDALEAIATALGFIAVVTELWLSRRQQRTALEDGLTRDYRELVPLLSHSLLVDGDAVDLTTIPSKAPENVTDVLRYVNLCNQQIFLRLQGRVSKATWEEWEAGIQANLTRPQIAHAWSYIRDHSEESYEQLAKLVLVWLSEGHVDPYQWPEARRGWRLGFFRPRTPALSGGGADGSQILEFARRRRSHDTATTSAAPRD
jgi:hypothetical protein